MKWFTYDQNNSGGYFIDNDEVTHMICVQAENADAANAKAEEITKEYGEYCECCGERWYINEVDGDGFDVPSHYGEPLSSSQPSHYRKYAVLHFASGEMRKVNIGEPISL